MPARRDRADKSRRLAASAGMALGLGLALFGIGIDWLFPETSPGLGLPQLAVIAAGLSLSLGAVYLGRRGSAPQIGKRLALKALVTALLTLLALEIALTIAGIPAYYPADMPFDAELLPLSSCAEHRCHLDPDVAAAACAAGDLHQRMCIFNRQGYPDRDEFVWRADFAQRWRILFLGDSFTQGYSADIGHSFVETVEAALPDAVVWNTGIASNSTRDALLAFQHIAPELQPQLTILGFFLNDFRDNVLPKYLWFLLKESGELVHVRPYQRDRWGRPVAQTDVDAYVWWARGLYPPQSDLERRIGQTRLGGLALRLLDGLAVKETEKASQESYEPTRAYLRQLQDATTAQGSDLLVLLIPAAAHDERNFVKNNAELYEVAQAIMRELRIPFVDAQAFIDAVADYVPLPGDHWNNQGHAKVGALLTDCARAFFANGSLADCDGVVMP